MRTTLAIDDALLARAQELTGLKEKSAVIREALDRLDRARKRSTAGVARWDRTRVQVRAKTSLRSKVILVDTSVWIDHFRASNKSLGAILETAQVLMHPFVIGELAVGNFRHRNRVLADLSGLPHGESRL